MCLIHLIKLWGTFSTPPAMCIYSHASPHVNTGVSRVRENYSRCPYYCDPQSFREHLFVPEKRLSYMFLIDREAESGEREECLEECWVLMRACLVYFREGSPVHVSSSSFIEDPACPSRSLEWHRITLIVPLSFCHIITSQTVCKYTRMNILQEVLIVN